MEIVQKLKTYVSQKEYIYQATYINSKFSFFLSLKKKRELAPQIFGHKKKGNRLEIKWQIRRERASNWLQFKLWLDL